MGDIFDVEALLPQMVLALGLAMIAGNTYAWIKFRRGETPKGVDTGGFRPARAAWLMVVGAILSLWAGITLFV